MSDLRVSVPKPCSASWDAMRSEGRNRVCDRCEKIIYDLSQLTLEEAESLGQWSDEVCVRARVGADGVVEVKRGSSPRRMVATIGTTIGLLAASSQAAAEGQKLGAIKGNVLGSCGGGGRVIATAADGRVYYAKIGRDDRYKVKRLPAGSYEVKVDAVEPQPGPSAEKMPPDSASPAPKVTVEAGRTSAMDVAHPNACIIVGMLKIDDDHG